MKTEELSAIYHELNFWKGFVRTPRFLHGWVNDIKTPELHRDVYDFIKSQKSPKVLDVGSGVVSILTGTVSKEWLFPVDPLGDLYSLIFDYAKFPNVNKPKAATCEELYTPEGLGCDIVHMSNALDHTQDPVLAFWNLFQACKPGGHVIIQGFENEAKFENWQGFHQWNLTLPDQLIRVEDKEGKEQFLTDHFEVIDTQRIQFESKTWFIWIAKKKQ